MDQRGLVSEAWTQPILQNVYKLCQETMVTSKPPVIRQHFENSWVVGLDCMLLPKAPKFKIRNSNQILKFAIETRSTPLPVAKLSLILQRFMLKIIPCPNHLSKTFLWNSKTCHSVPLFLKEGSKTKKLDLHPVGVQRAHSLVESIFNWGHDDGVEHANSCRQDIFYWILELSAVIWEIQPPCFYVFLATSRRESPTQASRHQLNSSRSLGRCERQIPFANQLVET